MVHNRVMISQHCYLSAQIGCLSLAFGPQAIEEMYSAFTEGFTGRWAEAVRSGTAGDLCPADIFGPDAAGGAEAVQVTLPARQQLWDVALF